MATRKVMPEPFKIKMVEPIRLIPKAQRIKKIREVHFNLFRLKARDIFIDLLTDSGTSAMSDRQWSGLLMGDESYAGSRSFDHLEAVVQEMMGFRFMLPVHQGRPAENILFTSLIRPGQIIPGNAHFDSTSAHIRHKQGVPINLPAPEALDPGAYYPFKGNIDLDRLEHLLKKERGNIPFCLMTLTNNTCGGQPVSMANLKAARKMTLKYGVSLYIDAARCAENAYFIQEREERYKRVPIKKIIKEMMSHADGCTMSCKKDGLVNIGGLLCVNDRALYDRCCQLLILMEGFITYGGLAGRDLEAMARGLQEVTDKDYLAHRIGQVRYFGERLKDAGIPIMNPTGGHAVYIDAKAFLPHIPQDQFPGQVTAVEAFIESGVRCAEMGAVAFTTRDKRTGRPIYPELELTRLALPRRVYTQSHIDFVVEGFMNILKRRDKIRGLKLIGESRALRHFLARFARVGT